MIEAAYEAGSALPRFVSELFSGGAKSGTNRAVELGFERQLAASPAYKRSLGETSHLNSSIGVGPSEMIDVPIFRFAHNGHRSWPEADLLTVPRTSKLGRLYGSAQGAVAQVGDYGSAVSIAPKYFVSNDHVAFSGRHAPVRCQCIWLTILLSRVQSLLVISQQTSPSFTSQTRMASCHFFHLNQD